MSPLLTAAEYARLAARQADPEGSEAAEREADRERTRSRLLWSAVMLALDLGVCGSILLGRSVLARQLDAVALRRALRGAALPSPHTYLTVEPEMLDAIAEGGPFVPREERR